MKTNAIPVITATSLVSTNQTVFSTFSKEVTVKAPSALIKDIIKLCDGVTSIETVTEKLSAVWEPRSVTGLLGSMFDEGVILDGRNLQEEFWETIQNPMKFPVLISKERVSELVQDGKVRHRQNSVFCNHQPSYSSLTGIIHQRKSVRIFSGESIEFQTIINLLWVGYGEFYSEEDKQNHVTVPSAGALYPLIFHICLFKQTGELEPGVYRVYYSEQGLVGFELVSDDYLKFARAFLNPAGILKGIHGVVVISGSFTLSGEKYGNRSILYVSLEAGHAAQNILLEASLHDVATLEIGGFVDDMLSESLRLPELFHPLTTIAFGKESTQEPVNPHPTLEVSWAVPQCGNYKPEFAIASARLSSKRSWAHGRDKSPELALVKAIAETKEWTACGCIPELTKARFCDLDSAIDPRDIIAFQATQYWSKQFPFEPFGKDTEYEWVVGYDKEDREHHVLADLVYFPYFPDRPYYAYSNSSGCAAHPDYEIAVKTATLELIERDAFMNAYLSRCVRPAVSIDSLPDQIPKRIRDIQKLGFEVWVMDHSLEFAPVIMVFAQHEGMHYSTCASCASFDVEYAVSHALSEVEASVLSQLQNGKPKKTRPIDVSMPLDHGRLYGQKRYFRSADFLISRNQTKPMEEVGQYTSSTWEELLERFEEKNLKHIVVPLHLSDEYGGNNGLHIVRTLVPGLVPMTFGYKQEPKGMKRIYEVAQWFSGVELSCSELSDFPHPFE